MNLQKLLHPCWVFAFTNSLSSNSLPRDVGVSLTSTLLQTTTPTIAQMVVPHLEYCERIRSTDFMYMCDVWVVMPKTFESLDFLYVPAPNIHESIRYYTSVLDGELLWKIHAYGVWVACVKLSNKEPYILLADHIEKKDLMLIYRVDNLDKAASELRTRGWREDKRLEIPNGPCCTFRDPADNPIVIYENRRPHVMEEFKGRIDND